MSKLELATEIDVDPSQLYRERGIKELMDSGRVVSDRKVGGYYLPDRTPTAN